MSLPSEKSRIKILYVGGCLVIGYPVGQSLGYTDVAVDILKRKYPSADFEQHYLAYVNLREQDQELILSDCSELAPDVVVLQLGHYETAVEIKKRWHQLWHPSQKKKKRGKDISSRTQNYTVLPNSYFQPWGAQLLKNAGKFFMDFLLILLGHPRFIPSEFEEKYDRLLASIDKTAVPHVIVLSTIPTVDAAINRYRKKAPSILERVAKKHGAEFVDTAVLWRKGARDFGRMILNTDGLHLNVEGHTALGELLAEKLEKVLKTDLAK